MAHPADDKNFRLSENVRPRRYGATLTLDMEQKRFSGEETIDLTVQQGTREIILHANELTVSKAVLTHTSGNLTANVRPAPASETVVLTFDREIPVGESRLEITWTGNFCGGLRGLYSAGTVACTQFEAADARRLFPSFDEPLFKARWALTVRIPEGLTALSNGPIVSDQPDGTGPDGQPLRKVTFAETELLSSYLVALVVGKLASTAEEKVGDIPVRTWALPEKSHLTRFGQDAAMAALPRLQEYFGLPYAFGKVDQVGIPDFEAGAMENAGLITYREVALLLDPKTAPLSVQKRVAEVVTHELAHQWFGNWVTMKWWDDLWLNEAFATWMAYKIVDAWKPEWRVWLDFDSGTASAMHLDALQSTHPIRGEVHNASEAGEAFDLITYEKGGAVLRMIEGFLGADAFREGIRAYMRKHARANAVADDLWSALAEASSQPVVKVANAWIRQSGFPLLSLSLSDRTLKLSQRRFYSQPGMTSAETWPVPVVVRYADQDGVHEARLLLETAEGELAIPGTGNIRWVVGNMGSTGFYRVSYDSQLLSQLAANLSDLEPAERIALLSDQWALVRAGLVPVADLLDLAARFGNEQDDAVLDELVGRLGYIENRLTQGAEQEQFRAFVRTLLGAQLEKLGWTPRPDENDRVRLRRAAVLRAVGSVGRAPEAVAEARKRVDALLGGDNQALDPNLLDPAVGMAARAGDAALFDRLLAKIPTEADPASKRRYLMALTAFEDPKLVQRAQALLFSGTVPMQDVAFYTGGLLGNRVGQPSFWELMQKDFAKVRGRTGNAPMLLRRVVEAIGALKDRPQLDQARALFSREELGDVKQAVAQTLERLSQDVALREKNLPEVSRWLAR